MRSDLPFIALMAVFVVYAAVFIGRSSFVVAGERYFCLFDDAMISMRYARNLVEGHGLVYNIGELVEGFTNPLWTMFMAAVHLLPLPDRFMSLPVQIASAVLLACNLLLVRAIALRIAGGSRAVATGAATLTAFYLPLNHWGLMGMETALQVAIVGFAVWRLLDAMDGRRFPFETLVVLGIGMLLRIDMTALFLAVAAFQWWVLPRHRRRTLLWGVGLLALFLGGQTLLRLWYYGDPLPNTYYVKMTGYPVFLRIVRGLVVWLRFLRSINPLLLLLTVTVTVATINRRSGLVVLIFAVQSAYSVYVGGDAWEVRDGANRFLAVAMPMYFVLFAHALMLAAGRLRKIVVRGQPDRLGSAAARYAFPVFVAASVLLINLNVGPFSLGCALTASPGDDDGLRQMTAHARLVEHITDEDASVGMTWAGAFPYFSRRPIVDFLGKTDPYIAHLPMRRVKGPKRFTAFYPGHLKYDFAYSIGERKPDIFFQYWGDMEEIRRHMRGVYVQWNWEWMRLNLRSDSPHIRWEFITEDGRPPVPPPDVRE